MSIVTTVSPVYQISTSIAYGNQTVTITTVNTGIVGPKGDVGPQGPDGPKGDIGPQGPEYQGDDMPDFTLIFDNKLI